MDSSRGFTAVPKVDVKMSLVEMLPASGAAAFAADLLLAACAFAAAAVSRALLNAWKEVLKRPPKEQLDLETGVS